MDIYEQILEQYWGYSAFRPLQRAIIESVAAGHDTLALMPTGGGKSLTFQIPTLSKPGICIVVTPLIALMKDQVAHLRQKQIKAATVHTGMSQQEIITTLENCIYGDYKFLYISPERITSAAFSNCASHMRVSLIAIDEAHCISQWGYDFRPSYLNIPSLREIWPQVPILALTATATPQVAIDIQQKLAFTTPNLLQMSFERRNLHYRVLECEDKESKLLELLQSCQGSAIVYVRSRKRTKEIASLLSYHKLSADYYHAGIDPKVRALKQEQWSGGQFKIMVATNAFGMGIDKSDVRLVVHLNLPNSLEEYFQEAGRAGRDGNQAHSYILHSRSDTQTLKKRVSDTFPPKSLITDIYDNLGNYLQVAVGGSMNQPFDFSLEEFCKQFHHPIIQTHHALGILELSGYIEYVEAKEQSSRVQIVCQRDALYYMNLNDRFLDTLLQALMRNYSGIFTDPIYINEQTIALQLGTTREAIYNGLKYLREIHLISYSPSKVSTTIRYLTRREEGRHLMIPKEVYEQRLERYKQRIDQFILYLSNRQSCRSKQLLHYFGEADGHNCGGCDVCLSKNREIDAQPRIQELIDQISTTALPVVDIMRLAPSDIQIIRKLLDEKIFTIVDDILSYTPKC